MDILLLLQVHAKVFVSLFVPLYSKTSQVLPKIAVNNLWAEAIGIE